MKRATYTLHVAISPEFEESVYRVMAERGLQDIPSNREHFLTLFCFMQAVLAFTEGHGENVKQAKDHYPMPQLGSPLSGRLTNDDDAKGLAWSIEDWPGFTTTQ